MTISLARGLTHPPDPCDKFAPLMLTLIFIDVDPGVPPIVFAETERRAENGV